MAEIDRQNFEVVRRGYDIDQVDEFLVRQAEAWRAELYEARRRLSEMEGELGKIAPLEAEVEQARRQQDALTMTLQTAAQARDEMLAKAESDVASKRAEAEAEIAEELAGAKAQAAQILADAEQEANDVRHQSRMRTDELMMAQEEQLRARQEELDTEHAEAKERYERAEQALAAKITDLNSMREALVTGLEAIASGGLAALEEVGDVLAEVGIVGNDDSAVAELLESSHDPELNGAEASAEIAATSTDTLSEDEELVDESTNGSAALNGAS